MILFAMGSVQWFSTPSKSFSVLRKALGFLRRAVSILEETHGDEAFWRDPSGCRHQALRQRQEQVPMFKVPSSP